MLLVLLLLELSYNDFKVPLGIFRYFSFKFFMAVDLGRYFQKFINSIKGMIVI